MNLEGKALKKLDLEQEAERGKEKRIPGLALADRGKNGSKARRSAGDGGGKPWGAGCSSVA